MGPLNREELNSPRFEVVLSVYRLAWVLWFGDVGGGIDGRMGGTINEGTLPAHHGHTAPLSGSFYGSQQQAVSEPVGAGKSLSTAIISRALYRVLTDIPGVVR